MTMNGNTKDVNYQPLASEIITDLQKENEKLKAELKAQNAMKLKQDSCLI